MPCRLLKCIRSGPPLRWENRKLDNRLRQEIIRFIQGDIPVTPRPYFELALQLGVAEQDIIAELATMKREGIIRRLGAVLRHQKAGFTVNALVAWKVDPDSADRIGDTMAREQQVSHCYFREVPEEFPYNLFTMIHSRSDEELQEIIRTLTEQSGINEHIILPSLKELKKVSMSYY